MRLDDMHDVLRLAIDVDEPPLTADPAAVFGKADRIRTRQRIATVVAGLAVGGLAVGTAAATITAPRPHHEAAGQGTTGDPTAAPGPSGQVASAQPTPVKSGMPTSTPATRRPEVPAATVLATLKRLLPGGATVSAPQSQDGYAGVVLTDPVGKTRVEVNVQPNTPIDPYTCADDLIPPGSTCTNTTLPDGTRVVATDGPDGGTGHDRIVCRIVNTWRADGTRVVAAAYNAVLTNTNQATRPVPFLTLAQLQAIATDPAWTS